jgi:antitoxin ParD1/3/4
MPHFTHLAVLGERTGAKRPLAQQHSLMTRAEICCYRVRTFLTLLHAMPSKSTITASLTPELTAFIAAKVKTGHYRSASEVVRAALRLLLEQDRSQESNPDQRKPASGQPDAR